MEAMSLILAVTEVLGILVDRKRFFNSSHKRRGAGPPRGIFLGFEGYCEAFDSV